MKNLSDLEKKWEPEADQAWKDHMQMGLPKCHNLYMYLAIERAYQ